MEGSTQPEMLAQLQKEESVHVDLFIVTPTSTATALPLGDTDTASSPLATSSVPPTSGEVPGVVNAVKSPPSRARSITSPSAEATPTAHEPVSTTLSPTTFTTPSATKEGLAAIETAQLTPPPSKSASASTRAPSPNSFDIWTSLTKEARFKTAQDAHHKRAHIFGRTRQMMRHKTHTMVVTASRGYQRTGYLPTRSTAPPMLQRRYSIDVSTRYVTRNIAIKWTRDSDIEVVSSVPRPKEHEPVPPPAPVLPLPNTSRYLHLNRWESTSQYPEWDGKVYLQLGDVHIKNYYFNHILTINGHAEAWMDDSILNTALEALRRITCCSNHRIDILDTNTAQILHMADAMNEAQDVCYDYLRQRFNDKKWIFIPINDGVDAIHERDPSGTHWSLVIVNRIHKHAFYYDSMWRLGSRIMGIAQRVTTGLLQVLGEDIRHYIWCGQENSPNQWTHNQCTVDDGACGPFVWSMCKYMIGHIKTHRKIGREGHCDLTLDENFPNYFRVIFDSWLVRQEMWSLIAHFKRRDIDVPRFIEDHDRAAVEGEEVVFSLEPLVACEPPMMQPVAEDSTGTITEEEEEKDGGIALDDEARTSHSFVDDSNDSILSEAPTEPAHDIRLDDDDTENGTAYDDTDEDDECGRHGRHSSEVSDLFTEEASGYNGAASRAMGVVHTRPDEPQDKDRDAVQQTTQRRCNSVESEDWLVVEEY